jgi:cytochrome c
LATATILTRGTPPSDELKKGASLIRSYGCGTCHVVPGVADANGHVGPPLTEMGRRIYIAGYCGTIRTT